MLRKRDGFTLIEVSLSLAIVAIAVVPVIAMLAAGLNTNRQSSGRAITSQIVDQVGRDVEQADFATLPGQLPIYHFDDQGVRVAAGNFLRVFTARVTIIKKTDLPSDNGLSSSHNLARILIDVAPNPSGLPESELFEEDDDGALISPKAERFTLFVSRND